jgi:hypothetical protein
MTDIQKTRLIVLSILAEEKAKTRDMEPNGSPFWGPLSRSFSDGITHIETEIDKKISLLENGVTIYEILPALIKEEV